MVTRKGSRPFVAATAALALGLEVIALTMSITSRRDYGEIAFVSEPLAETPAIPTGEITSSSTIAQTFHATRANLAGVDVYLSNYHQPNRSPVVATVSHARTGKVLRVSTAPPGTIVDNRYHSFSFPVISQSQGRSFVVTLTSPQAYPGQAVTAWLNDDNLYPKGSAYLNSVRHPQHDLVATLDYRVGSALVELVNRASQYKPRFLKGRNLKLLAILALLVTVVAAGVVASTVLGSRDLYEPPQHNSSKNPHA